MEINDFMKELFRAVKAAAAAHPEISEVREQETEKVNRGTLRGIAVVFCGNGERVPCPVFYYEDMYEAHRAGKTVVEIAGDVIGTAIESRDLEADMSRQIDRLLDGDLGGLHLVAVNPAGNGGIIEKCSSWPVCDLTCIPVCRMDANGEVRLDRHIQEGLGLTDVELFAAAERNAGKFHAVKGILRLLTEAAKMEIEVPPEEETMFVLTGGMAGLLYGSVRAAVASTVGDGVFYVIPSSVDECLIVPSGRLDCEPEGLRQICQQVNGTMKPVDVLGDNIYLCDACTGRIEICNTAEERAAIIGRFGEVAAENFVSGTT